MEDIAVIQMDYKPDPSLPRAIILDLSVVNFLDTVGVKTLSRVRTIASSEQPTTHRLKYRHVLCVLVWEY